MALRFLSNILNFIFLTISVTLKLKDFYTYPKFLSLKIQIITCVIDSTKVKMHCNLRRHIAFPNAEKLKSNTL